MFVENLKPFVEVAQILAGFGIVTVLLAILKRNLERRCWRTFKRRVDSWMDRLRDNENRHPHDLTPREWKVLCERMLNDSGFSPIEINQMPDISVIVAKGIASDKFFF